MKYKAGDKVRIISRDHLEKHWHRDGDIYEFHDAGSLDLVFNESMLEFCGKEMTIDALSDEYGYDSDLEGFYNMKEDQGYWGWSERMITSSDVTSKVIEVLKGVV